MMNAVERDRNKEKKELFFAISQISSRGLLHSAKWASELLDNYNDLELDLNTDSLPSALIDDTIDSEKCLLAKSYFDLKEYYRASHVLKSAKGHKALFLKNYSLYLAGEKRKLEESQERGQCTVNKELKSIEKELENLYMMNKLDGFSTYLYGIILSQLEDTSIQSLRVDVKKDHHKVSPEQNSELYIRSIFIESIKKYPWNWSAWLDLSSTIHDSSTLSRVSEDLPDHQFKLFWKAHSLFEMQYYNKALSMYEHLYKLYPENNYIKAQMASATYYLKQFDVSKTLFESLIENDPYRIEHLDIYSYLLYIGHKKEELSYLAHNVHNINKYCAETCCIIGNYYSIRENHEMAIVYFQRALKLNPKYHTAWLLLGQEYLQRKNTSAAAVAFRKAVDINKRDFRAWYNLGYTYELLKLRQYALYYYSKACELNPLDFKVWDAMGQCFIENGQTKNAEMCFKRVSLLKGQAQINEEE